MKIDFQQDYIPDLVLYHYLLKELTKEEMQVIAERLNVDEELKSRYDEIVNIKVPPMVKENLKTRLESLKKREQNKIIPFILKFSALAAMLVLGFVLLEGPQREPEYFLAQKGEEHFRILNEKGEVLEAVEGYHIIEDTLLIHYRAEKPLFYVLQHRVDEKNPWEVYSSNEEALPRSSRFVPLGKRIVYEGKSEVEELLFFSSDQPLTPQGIQQCLDHSVACSYAKQQFLIKAN